MIQTIPPEIDGKITKVESTDFRVRSITLVLTIITKPKSLIERLKRKIFIPKGHHVVDFELRLETASGNTLTYHKFTLILDVEAIEEIGNACQEICFEQLASAKYAEHRCKEIRDLVYIRSTDFPNKKIGIDILTDNPKRIAK